METKDIQRIKAMSKGLASTNVASERYEPIPVIDFATDKSNDESPSEVSGSVLIDSLVQDARDAMFWAGVIIAWSMGCWLLGLCTYHAKVHSFFPFGW